MSHKKNLASLIQNITMSVYVFIHIFNTIYLFKIKTTSKMFNLIMILIHNY